MNIFKSGRADTALDQLNLIIDATFSSIDRYTALQSLYTALDHQLGDGLMGQQESDRMRFIVGKLWDLKLQIHMIEKECAQLSDVIGHVISLMLLGGYNYKITVCLRMHTFVCEMMSRLIAKGIIRSYSMRQRRAAVNLPLVSCPIVMFVVDSCLMLSVICT